MFRKKAPTHSGCAFTRKESFEILPPSLPKPESEVLLEQQTKISQYFEKVVERPLDPIHENFYKQYSLSLSSVFQRINEYHQWVKKGKDHAKQCKLFITGLVRNAESSIPGWKEWISQHIEGKWKDYCVVIIENNSKDRTRPYLLQWADENKKVHILCQSIFEKNTEHCELSGEFRQEFSNIHLGPDADRIQKMSLLRNLYVAYAREFVSTWDYSLVIDFDLKGQLFSDGFYHALALLEKDTTMDGIFCNGLLWQPTIQQFQYYDSFAHIEKEQPMSFETRQEKAEHDRYVHEYVTIRYTWSDALHPVTSAFGGCGLYRMSPFLSNIYDYSPSVFCCEHSFFHKKMKRLFVNPHFIFLIFENNNSSLFKEFQGIL